MIGSVADLISLKDNDGCCDNRLGKAKEDTSCLGENGSREASRGELWCVRREKHTKLVRGYERVG